MIDDADAQDEKKLLIPFPYLSVRTKWMDGIHLSHEIVRRIYLFFLIGKSRSALDTYI